MTLSKPVLYIYMLLLCCSSLNAQQVDSVRQVDMIDYLVKIFKINTNDEKRDANKLHFSLFPTQSNATGGKVVISSVNASFLAGDKSNTNVSSFYFIPYLT